MKNARPRSKQHEWINVGTNAKKCVACGVFQEQVYKGRGQNGSLVKRVFSMNGIELTENPECKKADALLSELDKKQNEK